MDRQNTTRSAHATSRQALASATGHVGPTADRYHSALGRYVEAVVGDRSSDTESGPQPRLTFPPITVSDVMTRAVVSAYQGAPFKEIAAALERNNVNAVPVIDEDHKVIGVVTASDLLARVAHTRPVPRGHRRVNRAETHRKEHGVTAKELMTAPAVTISRTTTIADAARTLALHRIRSMPVVDRSGVLVGMVSRADLIKVFLRTDDDILNDVLRDVVRLGLVPGHRAVRVEVSEGVVTLSGRVDSAIGARRLICDTTRIPGVIDVHDALEFRVNDVYLPLSR